MITNNIEELFGTLQQSVVGSWRKHLKTSKYSAHMALDEYYKEMPELIDNLIEHWMGTHDKVKEYKNVIDSTSMSAIQYLSELVELTKNGYDLLEGDKDLESDLDAIASQIKSTLYKLKELKESDNSLSSYITNCLNEARIGVAASIGTLKDMDSFALTKVFNMMIDGEETMNVKDQNGKYVPEDQVGVVKTWLTNQCTIDRIDWDSTNNKNVSDPEWFFKTSKLKRTPLYIFWAFDKPEPFKSKTYENKAYIIHINAPQTGRNRVVLHAILDILKNGFVRSGGIVVDNITKAYTYTSC